MERQDFCKEKENAICEEIKNIKKNENTRQRKKKNVNMTGRNIQI